MTAYPIAAVDLAVRDLDRSVEFYRGALDLAALPVTTAPTVDGSGRTARTAVLSAGSTLLRLTERPDAVDSEWVPDDLQRGFRHVGFQVSDIDERAARIRDGGATFRMQPTDAYGGVRICFFYDPDGTLLELISGQLAYDRIVEQQLVDAERARPVPGKPRFDHVAVTVDDLESAAQRYSDALGFAVAGQLLRDDDPRGFVITYLHAGDTVLEVFTYTDPKTASPWQAEPVTAGFRDIAVAVPEVDKVAATLADSGATRVGNNLMLDPDGLPVCLEDIG